jgi:uncharacterized protein YndB with AHSA1/START domain
MTRFGVMKHLRILEAAGLLTTRRAGREKLHYLNTVPIQLVADRWISRYARPFAHTLAALSTLEKEDSMHHVPQHVHEAVVRAGVQRVWDAITSPDETRRYYHGTAIESDFEPGSPVVYRSDDGTPQIEGEIVEVDAPHRLVMSCRFLFDDDAAAERPSRVTWDLTDQGDGLCLVTITHDDFDRGSATDRIVEGGWTLILSGLKTLIETGQPLTAG